jgi:hypothetical protein
MSCFGAQVHSRKHPRPGGDIHLILYPAADVYSLDCRYSYANAPIQKEMEAREVGAAAAFLLSPLASAITGSVVYVDNGLNCMGLAMDSAALVKEEAKVLA